MVKFGKIISGFLSVILVIGLAFCGGYWFRGYREQPQAETVENQSDEFDLKLPTETEKRVVTKEEVEVKLQNISELTSCEGRYTVTKSAEYSRHLVDKVQIPGTTNKINLKCNGVVKIGYDMAGIVVKVNENDNANTKTTGTIYISLPEPRVVDNYVIWDDVECSENNNILNPIDFDQYDVLIGEIKDLGLKQATDDGVFEKADENIRNVIKSFLAAFENYEIVFMN